MSDLPVDTPPDPNRVPNVQQDLHGEIVTWPCQDCRHLDVAVGLVCAAFPEGIPAEILEGDHWHREPFPGDGGVRYEQLPAQETEAEVNYAEVRSGPDLNTVGYLWAGADGSGGFWRLGQDSDAHQVWKERCREAARAGFTPQEHLDYWLDQGTVGIHLSFSMRRTQWGTAGFPPR